MADKPEETTRSVTPAEGAADAAPSAPRSPRPGAGAASRARRIGGRPTRAGDTTGAADAADAPDATTASTDADTDADTDSDADSGQAAAVGTDGDTLKPARTRSDPVELPGWLRWAPAAILAVGVIAMAVVVFVVSNGVWRNKPSVTSERDQVLAAAKNCVAVVSTYKYTDLAAYRSKGMACAMGQFRTDFAKAVDDVIKPKAPQLKAVQTAQINKGGLQAVANGQWTVVVYGQVNVINTSTPKGRIDPLGAVVRMQRSHGKWLIAKLDLINGTGIS